MKAEMEISGLLKGTGLTLSAAESCTGGRIAHLITTVSGASGYFLGGVVSYAVSVKESVLGVSPEIILGKGVVSSETAAAMAEGVRSLTGSTFSVATTGLAEGSDEFNPEGTVWIGVSGPAGTATRKFNTVGTRKENIRRFTDAALRFLRKYISDYLSV